MSPLSHGVGAFVSNAESHAFRGKSIYILVVIPAKNMHIGFTVAAGCATINRGIIFLYFWSYFNVNICCDSTAEAF